MEQDLLSGNMLEHTTHTRGITAIEILVGVGIAAFILVFSVNAIMLFTNTSRDIAEQTQALYLAEEALEMVRFIRDDQWSKIGNLTDGTTYYLDVSPTVIGTTSVPEVIGVFTRSFVVDSVERNGSDDIVGSGTEDPDSKYVTATVSWGSPVSTVSLTTILADINNP
jgi:type II secretory pathway pseudopilin PulG